MVAAATAADTSIITHGSEGMARREGVTSGVDEARGNSGEGRGDEGG